MSLQFDKCTSLHPNEKFSVYLGVFCTVSVNEKAGGRNVIGFGVSPKKVGTLTSPPRAHNPRTIISARTRIHPRFEPRDDHLTRPSAL